MAEKRILLAYADADAVAGFRQALGEEWDAVAAVTGPAALAEMEKQPADVVVADLDLPELNGAEFLNGLRTKYPKTVLFILASEADKERVMEHIVGAHQFLTKPCDSETLKNAAERALALDIWIASNRMRELVSRVRSFPTVPSLYIEVLAALRSPEASTEQVGKILAKDMAMMTKLLQVINSAYFGLSRKITDPVEAVGILGFDAVKSMVMSIKLLSQYDKLKPVYFSIDRLWRHSTEVARTAKHLTAHYTGDRALAETAYTAGLMHDMGKVVLAANFDEQYRGAQSLARKQRLTCWEVEKEIFGASHAEIGAYLLGLWGMPLDLLEATALHHMPDRTIIKGFTPLTAVHIANSLEHELNPEQEGMADSKMDEAYLAQVGVLDRIEAWRVAVAKRDFSRLDAKAKPAERATAKSVPSMTAASKPGAAKPANTAAVLAAMKASTAPQTRPASAGGAKWMYPAIGGIAVALLLCVWGGITLLSPRGAKNQTSSAPTTAAVTPATTPTVAATPNPAPAAATQVAETTPTPSTATVVRARTDSTPVTTKSGSKEPTFGSWKLQGVFFNSDQPSAIVNGQYLNVNDRYAGATVIAIGASSITFDYQGQRKTLTLK